MKVDWPTRAEKACRGLQPIAMAVLMAVELLTILGLFLVSVYVVTTLLACHPTRLCYQMSHDLVQLVGESWKGLMVLAALLFFRTIKTFMEQAKRVFGIEREIPQAADGNERQNPAQGVGS